MIVLTTLTLEVLCNLLVPESDIRFVVVDNRTKFCIATEVRHEIAHTVDTLGKVDNAFLRGFCVERSDSVFDSFPQNCWETGLHSRMCERVFVITTISWPRRVIWVDLLGAINSEIASKQK